MSIFSVSRRGFTLIELLVVIAVVGVLAGAVIAIINPNAQLARARDAKRKNDIRVIKQALEEYLVLNGSYPNTTGVNNWVYSYPASGTPWITQLSSAYIKKMPNDPLNNGYWPWDGSATNYSYAYGSNGVYYNLVSLLENASDPDRCEIKKWFIIDNGTTGGGQSWCPPGYGYSNKIYSTTNLNK